MNLQMIFLQIYCNTFSKIEAQVYCCQPEQQVSQLFVCVPYDVTSRDGHVTPSVVIFPLDGDKLTNPQQSREHGCPTL